ncbi:receptor-type tyrosine-protein phosphatase kappa-like [Saccostrea echinata]|uniref:receptor-type tyrosine-protein phosphatase kappa-like n=1 Tax=Saccostrea echinata TaxID=191078 RepID=UPI002A7EEA0D|nr:receptor-type tyrosine-protein phosphatase kappa-like [Saccostrea echinata]
MFDVTAAAEVLGVGKVVALIVWMQSVTPVDIALNVLKTSFGDLPVTTIVLNIAITDRVFATLDSVIKVVLRDSGADIATNPVVKIAMKAVVLLKTACDSYHFGAHCTSECSNHCRNGTCFQNGTCTLGCIGKLYGDKCEKECRNCAFTCDKISGECDKGCVDGTYGSSCNMKCSRGCVSGCDQYSGHCNCMEGWQGDSCDNSPVGDSRTFDTSDMKTFIGAAVGTLLFILLAVVFLLFAIKLRRNKKSRSTPSMAYVVSKRNSEDQTKMYTEIGSVPVELEDPEEEPQIEKLEDAVYYNNLTAARDIFVADLLSVIKNKEADENEGFTAEFKSLPYGERFDCNIAKMEENIVKNRFKTTFPYDHSRVKLAVENGFTSDYINANYIENMEGRRDYIACQGPTANTLIDHWRMIWQEHIEYIVMLTNLIEGPKNKCHQYWPDENEELDLDPFSVDLIQEKVYAYFVMRIMTLRKQKVSESRTVVQFHYTRWPDHGTPNPLNLVVFHRHFRHKIKPSRHPILIHCSAGIGRTGTFIAFDVLSRYGKDNGKVNIIEYVKAMRKDRMTMIQNVDQYMFLYKALFEFFRRQNKYIRREEYLKFYSDLGRRETRKQITDEYNKLKIVKPHYEDEDFETGRQHLKLNMTDFVLPVEQYLVLLTSYCRGRSSYYNAVTLSSFTRADEFISAQLPVTGAAIDLARLLVDQESHFLISLNPLSDVNEMKIWVEEQVKHFRLDQYEITKRAQTRLTNEIRKTTVEIKRKKDGSHHLHILECLDWSHDRLLPADTSILINLIKQFCFDRKSEVEGHVTVMSMDGAACCGLFIAVYNAIEQLQQDNEVDICTIVQQLQCRRPEMISNKEEYEFCYRAIRDFLNTDSVYANA